MSAVYHIQASRPYVQKRRVMAQLQTSLPTLYQLVDLRNILERSVHELSGGSTQCLVVACLGTLHDYEFLVLA